MEEKATIGVCEACPAVLSVAPLVQWKDRWVCPQCYHQLSRQEHKRDRRRCFKSPHYIATAGFYNCPPMCSEAFCDLGLAAAYLAEIHDLSTVEAVELQQSKFLKLSLTRYGNEYCRIEECGCEQPVKHCFSGVYEEC